MHWGRIGLESSVPVKILTFRGPGTLFTARRYASAVLAVIVCLSVRLSVCLSFCLSVTVGVVQRWLNLGSD